jgi:hypothetical protein
MKTIAFALLTVLGTACYPAVAPGPEIRTAASSSAPFAEYRTFSFGVAETPPTRYQASAHSLAVEHRARQLVSSALREKGYVEDDTKPSFVVRLGAGTQEYAEANVEQDPTRSSPKETIDVGKLEVDVFDAFSNTAVWRGSATSYVDLTKDIDEGSLRRAVQAILATFPRHNPTNGQPQATPVGANGTT